ncbi:MAG TPA: NUDIX domain-containing protein [Caulobacteraceae bacterium]|nr:NUDIX domain-containing protein [Caulobacteraceae bacterium]
MPRAPLNVLVLPFRRAEAGAIEYAVFRRSDQEDECWQGVAGGVEVGESAEGAARRELHEEAGVAAPARWIALDSIASVPAEVFGAEHGWGPEVHVVLERAFGAELRPAQHIRLSKEHSSHRWLSFGEASKLLRWDSNRTALWELNRRLAAAGAAPRED